MCLAAGAEIIPERNDLAESVWMKEDQEFLWYHNLRTKINSAESFRRLVERRRAQPRPSQDHAQGIEVAAAGDPPQERGIVRGGTSTHERVVNDLAGVRQALE